MSSSYASTAEHEYAEPESRYPSPYEDTGHLQGGHFPAYAPAPYDQSQVMQQPPPAQTNLFPGFGFGFGFPFFPPFFFPPLYGPFGGPFFGPPFRGPFF